MTGRRGNVRIIQPYRQRRGPPLPQPLVDMFAVGVLSSIEEWHPVALAAIPHA